MVSCFLIESNFLLNFWIDLNWIDLTNDKCILHICHNIYKTDVIFLNIWFFKTIFIDLLF